eukprot:TRINITY_DN10084_c0_g3_i3.p2 TRINITY_DN10084_c0_g3~~TRINITY_DN10084_c0_g3_i3.p2  ORF type:complete len:144 (+),score=22.65 TRINITY_DN10084_c0_g3_i3:3377-3808(+)
MNTTDEATPYPSVIAMAKQIKADIVHTYAKPATSFSSWPSRSRESPAARTSSRPLSLDSSAECRRRRASSIREQLSQPSMQDLTSISKVSSLKPVPRCGIMSRLSKQYAQVNVPDHQSSRQRRSSASKRAQMIVIAELDAFRA